MKFSDEQMGEYRAALREHIGEEEFSKMTDQDIYKSAIGLVNLVKILLESDGVVPVTPDVR